ncbi:hypothetical protein DL89DRAFT_163914 [Linderina pennispora]|uniref:Uncharacterized protein n=1 Tax=Linderina pennispora TaxID=61395 RepID=A0A1Y1W862_9FUNG|nr:uncharacterized protein DL89DRAFT_163914 [Linderina pennispora]ORX69632.1 hypothetical protein DL89DRAFT_163914 [Linderina pennispora]
MASRHPFSVASICGVGPRANLHVQPVPGQQRLAQHRLRVVQRPQQNRHRPALPFTHGLCLILERPRNIRDALQLPAYFGRIVLPILAQSRDHLLLVQQRLGSSTGCFQRAPRGIDDRGRECVHLKLELGWKMCEKKQFLLEKESRERSVERKLPFLLPGTIDALFVASAFFFTHLVTWDF